MYGDGCLRIIVLLRIAMRSFGVLRGDLNTSVLDYFAGMVHRTCREVLVSWLGWNSVSEVHKMRLCETGELLSLCLANRQCR